MPVPSAVTPLTGLDYLELYYDRVKLRLGIARTLPTDELYVRAYDAGNVNVTNTSIAWPASVPANVQGTDLSLGTANRLRFYRYNPIVPEYIFLEEKTGLTPGWDASFTPIQGETSGDQDGDHTNVHGSWASGFVPFACEMQWKNDEDQEGVAFSVTPYANDHIYVQHPPDQDHTWSIRSRAKYCDPGIWQPWSEYTEAWSPE